MSPASATTASGRLPDLFAIFADAVRAEFEKRNFGVYVSTNTQSITVTEKGYVGDGEYDFHLKVRAKPVGRVRGRRQRDA